MTKEELIFQPSTGWWKIEEPLFWIVLSELLIIDLLKLNSPSLQHNIEKTELHQG